jgi:hypothetical protein
VEDNVDINDGIDDVGNDSNDEEKIENKDFQEVMVKNDVRENDMEENEGDDEIEKDEGERVELEDGVREEENSEDVNENVNTDLFMDKIEED